MNKRIKELAEQATTYIDPSANDGVCWHFDKKKFAESIIRECADIAAKNQAENMNWDIAEIIKEHFGVNE